MDTVLPHPIAPVPDLTFGLGGLLQSLIETVRKGVATRQARRFLAAFDQVGAPIVSAARSADDTEHLEMCLSELLADPEFTRNFCALLIEAFRLGESVERTPEGLDRVARSAFGATGRIGRLVDLERVRTRVSQKLMAEWPSGPAVAKKIESEVAAGPVDLLDFMTSPELSSAVVEPMLEMRVGDLAWLGAVWSAHKAPLPEEKQDSLLTLAERGAYAWLRIFSAYFPDDIPMSIVPPADRFLKDIEDHRAAARETAIDAAVVQARQSGHAEPIYPRTDDGRDSGSRLR